MIATSLVALALSSAALAGPSLTLNLGGAANFRGASAATVKATLTNTGDEVATLWNDPQTILSKEETDTFAISTAEGKAPAFLGKIIKPFVDVNDVTVLAPGESVTVTHNLGDAYDFTRTGAGAYSIDTSSAFSLVTDNGLETIYATTSALEAKLTGELIKPELAAFVEEAQLARRDLGKRATYPSCTTSQTTLLTTGATNAQAYTTESLAYLKNHTSTSTRYVTWFGTWTSARYTTVLGQYQNLANHAWTGNAYSCACTSSAYAYTYKTTPGQMWLCNAFWNAPATGTDSKAGTIVHESMHWNAIAGCSDYAYGQSAAKSLAISNPANAILNSDSHEYFSENTPALS